MQTIVAQITAADVAMITMTTKATKTRRSSKIKSCCSSDSQQKAASLLPPTKQVIARRDDIPPADRGGSKSVRGRTRSPHSSGGMRTDGSRHRLMPPTAGVTITLAHT